MNEYLKKIPFVAAYVLAVTIARAQTPEANASFLRDPNEPLPKNRFSLSYQGALNLRASFKHLGGAGPHSNPGSTATEQDHTYDDGYVRRDSGVGDGLTWNWGYINSSQVPGNDTIQFHSLSSLADGRIHDISDEQNHGTELVYDRLMGRAGDGFWGWEGGLNWLNIGVQTSRSAEVGAVRTTDTYPLNGVVPPQPPYSGSFNGPGPLISDTPTRTTSPAAATVNGRHELDADLFGLRVGPYYDLPLNQRLELHLSAGLALALVDSEFRYRETVVMAGASLGSARGSGHKTDFLAGSYIGANLSYALSKSWSLFGGVRYQYLTTFTQKVHGRTAELDFSSAVYLSGGLGFEF